MKKIREWLKSKNISLPLVIVIIGLIASCCILSTCWMIVTSVEPLPANSPPATQVLTITLVPTVTQVPTVTPRPTWTPVLATATPSSRLTPAEESYKAGVIDVTVRWAVVMSELGELFSNTDLLYSPALKLDLATSLATFLIINEDARDLEPSDRFRPSHLYLLEATQHFDKCIWLIADGVDGLDSEKLNQGTEELILGSECIGLATEELDKIDFGQ